MLLRRMNTKAILNVQASNKLSAALNVFEINSGLRFAFTGTTIEQFLGIT